MNAPDLEIYCPRCELDALVRFYGPCTECRSDLNKAAEKQAAWRAFVFWLKRFGVNVESEES